MPPLRPYPTLRAAGQTPSSGHHRFGRPRRVSETAEHHDRHMEGEGVRSTGDEGSWRSDRVRVVGHDKVSPPEEARGSPRGAARPVAMAMAMALVGPQTAASAGVGSTPPASLYCEMPAQWSRSRPQKKKVAEIYMAYFVAEPRMGAHKFMRTCTHARPLADSDARVQTRLHTNLPAPKHPRLNPDTRITSSSSSSSS